MRLALAGRGAWVKGRPWAPERGSWGVPPGSPPGWRGHRLHKRSPPLTRRGPPVGHLVPYQGPKGRRRWGGPSRRVPAAAGPGPPFAWRPL